MRMPTATEKNQSYLCKYHQDIVSEKAFDFNLCKDPQDNDQRRNDHRGPDTPF